MDKRCIEQWTQEGVYTRTLQATLIPSLKRTILRSTFSVPVILK